MGPKTLYLRALLVRFSKLCVCTSNLEIIGGAELKEVEIETAPVGFIWDTNKDAVRVHKKYFDVGVYSVTDPSSIQDVKEIYTLFNSNASGPNYFTKSNLMRILRGKGLDVDDAYVSQVTRLLSLENNTTTLSYEDWFAVATFCRSRDIPFDLGRQSLRDLEVALLNVRFIFEILATKSFDRITTDDLVLYIRLLGKSGTNAPFIMHKLCAGKALKAGEEPYLNFRDFVVAQSVLPHLGEDVAYLFNEENRGKYEERVLVLRELFVLNDVDEGRTVFASEILESMRLIHCPVEESIVYSTFDQDEYVFNTFLWNMARWVEADIIRIVAKPPPTLDEFSDTKKKLMGFRKQFGEQTRLERLVADKLSVDPVVQESIFSSSANSYKLSTGSPARAPRRTVAASGEDSSIPAHVIAKEAEVMVSKIKFAPRTAFKVDVKSFDSLRPQLDFSFDIQRILFGPVGIILWVFLPIIWPVHLFLHRGYLLKDFIYFRTHTLGIFLIWMPIYLLSILNAILAFRSSTCDCATEIVEYFCRRLSPCRILEAMSILLHPDKLTQL